MINLLTLLKPQVMLARAIGPLGAQVQSIYERILALWGPLLLLQEENPLTFLRTMMNQAELLTGLRKVSRVSILPKVKTRRYKHDRDRVDPYKLCDEKQTNHMCNGHLHMRMMYSQFYMKYCSFIQQLMDESTDYSYQPDDIVIIIIIHTVIETLSIYFVQ